MFRFAQRGAVEYLEVDELSSLGFLGHGFTTRRGGVSGGAFAGLNASFRVGDRDEDIRRNLAIVGETFAIPDGCLALMEQVHGDTIRVLDSEGPPPAEVPVCDGLVTARSGVALGVRSADCVPIFFVDRVRRVIGAAHAGWRGTAFGIAAKMVDAFVGGFGSSPGDILAAIGPAVGPCCYQVDAPVHAAFMARTGADRFLKPCRQEGRWMLDLVEANHLQIAERGVPETNILSAGLCTACTGELFFSHRASGGCTGRQVNVLMLREMGRRKNA